jgi:peroxiredoxin
MKGQHEKKHVVFEDDKQNVRDHINSFPAVDSHYCRSRTKKNVFGESLKH